MNARNLRKRRQGWAAVVYIPGHLQEQAARFYDSKGKRLKEVVRGLGTRDLREANRLKLPVIAKINAELAALQDSEAADYIAEARKLAESFDSQRERITGEIESKAEELLPPELGPHNEDEYAEEIAEAKRFYKIATRQHTPVSQALEAWLSEAVLGDTTYDLYQKAVEEFINWYGNKGVNEVDVATAGSYASWLRSTPSKTTKKKLAWNTFKRKIGTIAQFWDWMALRGYVDPDKRNPWDKQASAAPGDRKGKGNEKPLRAITKDEAEKWAATALASRRKHKQAMIDLIQLGWNSGARADDLCTLTVDQLEWSEDDQAMWVRFKGKSEKDTGDKGGKTDANARKFPFVCPKAIAVLKRRQKAAKKDGRLFPEVKPKKGGTSPYQGIQQHFNDIRREALGDAPVDYHSFRRAYTGAAERTTPDVALRHRIVGQKPKDFQSATYNKYLDRTDEFLELAKGIYERLQSLEITE